MTDQLIIEVRVRYPDGSRPDETATVCPTAPEYEMIRATVKDPDSWMANVAEYCTDALAFAFMTGLEVYEQDTPTTETE